MRCGKPTHPHDKCPACDATCHRCNHKGHYSSQCLSKTVLTAYQDDITFQQDTIISEETMEQHYLDAMGTMQETFWSVNLHIEHMRFLSRFTWVQKLLLSLTRFQSAHPAEAK